MNLNLYKKILNYKIKNIFILMDKEFITKSEFEQSINLLKNEIAKIRHIDKQISNEDIQD